MQTQRRHDYRSPVPVVTRIVDVLQAERGVNPSPHVERVVSLNNVLAPVIEAPVAQKKALTSEPKVLLMVPRDPARNKYQPGAVELSVPRPAVPPGTNLRRLIHFGIGKRLMPAFVPSPSAKHAHPIIERLFEIHAESVFDRRPERVCGDIR